MTRSIKYSVRGFVRRAYAERLPFTRSLRMLKIDEEKGNLGKKENTDWMRDSVGVDGVYMYRLCPCEVVSEGKFRGYKFSTPAPQMRLKPLMQLSLASSQMRSNRNDIL